MAKLIVFILKVLLILAFLVVLVEPAKGQTVRQKATTAYLSQVGVRERTGATTEWKWKHTYAVSAWAKATPGALHLPIGACFKPGALPQSPATCRCGSPKTRSFTGRAKK
jgi:hypothetical protein